MQPNCSHPHSTQGPGADPSPSQSTHTAGQSSCHPSGDVHIQLSSAGGEGRENASWRRSRLSSQSHSHGHGHSEGGGSADSSPDPEEHSSSISELRYVLQWLHRSLPYVLILGVKLIVQHIIGRV
uniref:Uncharacterized protein n=1 Tax=Pavo cristatus TaxID=9049 RepID=A0A8C9FVQ6_PAVCR